MGKLFDALDATPAGSPNDFDFTKGDLSADLGQTKMNQQAEDLGYVDREPKSGMMKVIDFVSRGQYASAALVDTIISQDGFALAEALANGASELFDPKKRLSYKDLIQKHAPGFAENNPKSTAMLGLVGDIAFDPTSYLTLGTGSGAKLGIKVAGTTGKAAVGAKAGKLSFFARKLTKEAAEGVDGKVMAKLNKEGQRRLTSMADNIAKDEVRLTQEGFKKRQVVARNLMDRGYHSGDAVEMATRRIELLNHQGIEGFTEKYTSQLATETATKRLALAINSSPELATKLLDTGGIKMFGKNITQGVIGKRIKEATGLTRVGEAIAQTAPAKWMKRAFSQDVPDEFKKLWVAHTVTARKGEANVERAFKNMFGEMDKAGRERVGDVLTKIDDMTTAANKAADSQYVDQQAQLADYLKQFDPKNPSMGPDPLLIDDLNTRPWVDELEIRETALRDAKLSAEEHSVAVDLYSEMSKIGKQENELGLLNQLRMNYFPRAYEAISDGKALSGLRAKIRNKGMSSLSAKEARKFDSIAQAEKMGFTPIRDAGVLYATRVADHFQALNTQVFESQADEMIGRLGRKAEKFGVGSAKAEKAIERQKVINDYVRYIGDSKYSHLSSDDMRSALRTYDFGQQIFKTFATVARPAFAVRQAFSNHFQAFIGAGKNGIRHLYDPRSAFDAALMLRSSRKGLDAPTIELTTVLGRKYNGNELMELAVEHDIIRSTAGVMGEITTAPLDSVRGASKMIKAIDRKRKVAGVVGDSKAMQGMAAVFGKAARYTNSAAFVEDYSRLAMFNNMIRSGHTPGQAAKLVDDALFDYQHALSIFEDRFVKRAVPFYSFQRFAVPLLAKATVKTPGRVANAGKTAKTLMEVYGKIHGGEELSPAERMVLPGWLLEQPMAFAGFDQEMKGRFKTFNNYSPLDVMNFTEFDAATGEIDIRASMMKSALSQITPYVKVPFEMMIGKDFFTERELFGPKGERRLQDTDMDQVLGTLVGQVTAGLGTVAGGTGGGLATIAAGGALGHFLGKLPGDVAKNTLGKLMGMEEFVDPRTGKRQVVVNAYAIHLLTSIAPALNESFKVSRNDKTPMEKTEQFLFGIPTFKADLQEQAGWRKRDKGAHTADLKRERNVARLRGNLDQFERSSEELRLWQEDLLMDRELLLNGGGIRGGQF